MQITDKQLGWLLGANILVALFSVFVCTWAVTNFSSYTDREAELKAQYTKELQRVVRDQEDRWTIKLESIQSQTALYVQSQVPILMRGTAPTININSAHSNGNTNGSVSAQVR